jgi:hypothetical protein
MENEKVSADVADVIESIQPVRILETDDPIARPKPGMALPGRRMKLFL